MACLQCVYLKKPRPPRIEKRSRLTLVLLLAPKRCQYLGSLTRIYNALSLHKSEILRVPIPLACDCKSISSDAYILEPAGHQ